MGFDLSPRWSRPDFSGHGRGKERFPGFLRSRAEVRTEGLHLLSPEGDAPLQARTLALCGLIRWDPGPGGQGDPVPQGTARAAWDTRGAWDPASLWREQKEAKQGSSLFGCHAPALRASSVSGSSSREAGNSPAGLENAASIRAPATSPLSPVSAAAGTAARDGGIASRAPRGPQGPREPTGRPGSCKEGKDASRGPEAPDQELPLLVLEHGGCRGHASSRDWGAHGC